MQIIGDFWKFLAKRKLRRLPLIYETRWAIFDDSGRKSVFVHNSSCTLASRTERWRKPAIIAFLGHFVSDGNLWTGTSSSATDEARIKRPQVCLECARCLGAIKFAFPLAMNFN